MIPNMNFYTIWTLIFFGGFASIKAFESNNVGYSYGSMRSDVPPISQYQDYYNYMNNQALANANTAGGFQNRRGYGNSYHYQPNPGPPNDKISIAHKPRGLWERIKAVLSFGERTPSEFFHEYHLELLADVFYSFFKWVVFFYLSFLTYNPM